MRLNPPPGWPVPPAGWTPPPDWRPDPSWPAPPPGWRLWVEETEASDAPGGAGPHWIMGGGAAVFIGAFLPLISNTSSSGYDFTVNSGAQSSTAVFGVILIGAGAALHYFSAPGRFRGPRVLGLAISVLALSCCAILGYGGFAIAGMAGFQEQTDLLGTVTVTYSPNIGLFAVLLGCLAAGWGAIRSVPHAAARRRVFR
jgi:hypothetical protein